MMICNCLPLCWLCRHGWKFAKEEVFLRMPEPPGGMARNAKGRCICREAADNPALPGWFFCCPPTVRHPKSGMNHGFLCRPTRRACSLSMVYSIHEKEKHAIFFGVLAFFMIFRIIRCEIMNEYKYILQAADKYFIIKYGHISIQRITGTDTIVCHSWRAVEL